MLDIDQSGNLLGTVYTGYIYDAGGNRVAKGTLTWTGSGSANWSTACNGLNNQDNWSFTPTNSYILGPSGEQMTETDGGGNWLHTNVYSAAGLTATYDVAGLHFQLSDWLGTRRVETDYAGNPEETCTNDPYGDDAPPCSTPAEQFYTGKERDSESGNDYFGARYMASTMGRFLSPDPMLNSGRPDIPQTWNRYTYALNNPLRIIDPTGLYNLQNNCNVHDKKCNAKFADDASHLKAAVADLTAAVDAMKDGKDKDKKDRLKAALKALGTQNDGNNVGVTFGAVAGSGAGHTDAIENAAGQFGGFKITLDPSKIQSTENYGIDAAHEATHINDLLDPRADSLSDFSYEYRGYETSVWAARVLTEYSGATFTGFTESGKSTTYQLWNSSWGVIDDKVMTQYITNEYKYSNGSSYKETTPHDPWGK